jgi:hypothetical protein
MGLVFAAAWLLSGGLAERLPPCNRRIVCRHLDNPCARLRVGRTEKNAAVYMGEQHCGWSLFQDIRRLGYNRHQLLLCLYTSLAFDLVRINHF